MNRPPRRVRRLAGTLSLMALLAGAPPVQETFTFDAPQCAGMSGFRAQWDLPIAVAEDGERLLKDGVIKDRGQTAVWGEKPVPLAFDAVHRRPRGVEAGRRRWLAGAVGRDPPEGRGNRGPTPGGKGGDRVPLTGPRRVCPPENLWPPATFLIYSSAMAASLTPERLRAMDPARIGPSDLRRLVACLNPNSPRPDCRDAALAKLEEIVAGASASPAPSACYSMHLNLLKIALDLDISTGFTGSIDSILPFLEGMKRPLIGHPALDMANAFLGRTRGRRLDPGELREALWLYDLNSLSAADREGTVLDLGSPAALKVEADFMHAFVDPSRVRAGDLRELLRDADPSIQKRARQWLERRGSGTPSPPEPASPSEDLARWVDGRHLLRAEGEGLTLEVSALESSMLRYQVLGLRNRPVFLMAGEFTDTVHAILKTFGRVCALRDPALDPEAALSSEPGAFLPAGKPAPHSFSWDRSRDALAATWKALDLTWLLRPGADDATILILEGSLRDVFRHYYEAL